ncbi:MAG: efflux RND transporter permease subunit, partial [Candidatus Omnitrophica bacterium]|nr:efflux RND transporter permease subunit [Candidatus Omnitrophota bacterium]
EVSIVTVYPGATPLDVEKLISVPIEKELKEVDGIKEISSASDLGSSFVRVKIDPAETNKRKVVNDIQDAVDRVQGLPKGIYEDPVVIELTNKQMPIIEVSLTGRITESKLQYYADTLEDLLEDIKGVARARKFGYRDREIQVQVDPQKMQEYYVSLDEIEQALAQRNISIPAGEINTETTEYSIRTTGEFSDFEEIEDIIIRANDSGSFIRIKDVAQVKDSFKKETIIYKTQGARSINLVILKKEEGDALTMVDEIKRITDLFMKNCPDDLRVSYVNDYSFYARRRLNVLKNNGWLGMILVVASLFFFLQWRVAAMTILGIPIAFFTSFIIMNMMGITVNLMSMFGLIIVLGMLVDDGIIVAENAYRYMEQGIAPRLAAIKGTEEVIKPVTTAVLTTIAAFSPLLFMSGIIGKFVKIIPTVVIIALVASLVEALVILPSHLADFVKPKHDSVGKTIGLSRDIPWFKKLINFYTRLVNKAIQHKYKVFAVITLILALSGFLAFRVIKFVFVPKAGIEYFFVRAEAPIGTPLSRTHDLIVPVEEIVAQIPEEELDSFTTSVGKIAEDHNDPFAGQASHLVQITVYLTPEQSRDRTVDEITAGLREKTKDIKGFTDLRFDTPNTGPPVGRPVEVKIRGEDFQTLDRIAGEYMDCLAAIEGVSDITWDHKPGKEEICVKVDDRKTAIAGLSVAQIAQTIRTVFEGNTATKIKPIKAEEETDVTVMFPKEFSKDINVFENILIRNKSGRLIPLKNVARIQKVPGTTTIHHLDGKRVVTASANIDTNKTTSLKVHKTLSKKFKDLSLRYMGYSVKYGGEQEETVDSMKSLLKAFLYAFLFIYLILSYTFKSIIQPFIIMLAIPFGLIGVVVAFLLHGQPFSFLALMGVVGLIGIVVNDAIVLVDFINKLRLEGLNRHDSIIKAGQMRLRPVILTTITTCGGLSTVAYGIGGKDPFLVPMALSICWGLAFATVLTLIVIPCIYSIIDDLALKLTHHS